VEVVVVTIYVYKFVYSDFAITTGEYSCVYSSRPNTVVTVAIGRGAPRWSIAVV